jgi:cell division protein FtsB
VLPTQDIQKLQTQVDQQKSQLADGEVTKLEIGAVREYRRTRQQQQQLEAQVTQLRQQLAQVGAPLRSAQHVLGKGTSGSCWEGVHRH